MRKAAGIIMLAFGIFVIVGGLPIMLQPGFGAPAQVWIGLALSVLLVAAGISVLRRKAYWWALLASVAMVVEGTTNAVWAWQDPIFQHHFGTATRLLWAVRGWAIWGIPGLLALVFLVKRRGEFLKPPPSEARSQES